MSKFKVGDIVIATEEANKRYHVTRCGWIGVVSQAEFDRDGVRHLGVFGNEDNVFTAKGVKDGINFALIDTYFRLLVDPNKVSDE